MKLFAILLTSLVSFSAAAVGTHECDGLDSIGNLMEAKSFEHVKVAYVTTEEPAAAPDHVLVFVYDHEMGVTCTAISLDADGNGFGYVDMSSLKSIGYDAKLGRLFSINVNEPYIDGPGKRVQIKFRANAITSKVTLE